MIRKAVPFGAALVGILALLIFGGAWLLGARAQTATGQAAPVASAGAHAHGGTFTVAVPVAIVPPVEGSRVQLTTARAAKPELGYTLSVRITSPAGRPVNDATIRFYELVDFFGQREELIGSATTDGQGLSTITYLPATKGTHTIVARFAGQGALVPSLGIADLDATVAAPAYKVDPPALAAFSRYVPYAAGVVVLVVWSLIAFSMLSTARGVIARADPTHRKGDTA
jgi:hypothetical protein